MKCVICNNQLKVVFNLKSQVLCCPECSLQMAPNAEFNHEFKSELDEESRVIGLKNLRIKNFNKIISELIKLKQNDLLGLEIGSAYGWWLELANNSGIKCDGLEPEPLFFQYYKNKYNVIKGFYPDAVEAESKYDFIIFNDVLEHIPDLKKVISGLKKNLKNDGLAIINIPMSSGFFYRLAGIFCKLFNYKSFLNRMWQFDFHSPHYFYFNEKNLTKIFEQQGFKLVKCHKLDTLDYDNLKSRISANKQTSGKLSDILTFLTKFSKPLINFLPADIKCFYFQKLN